jgi:hypothetical protein
MALWDFDFQPTRVERRPATRESLGLRELDERTNPSGFVLDDDRAEPCVEFEDDVEIGTCSTCGGYGPPGRECYKWVCRELGGTFC